MREKIKTSTTRTIILKDAPSLISRHKKLKSISSLSNIEKPHTPTTLLKKTGRFQSESRSISFYSGTIFSSFHGEVKRHNLLGVAQENMQLPTMPCGSKVLDVGAGTGYISRKIKDTFSADVYALEPELSDFDSCVEKLDLSHVEQLTLQEALIRFPEKYFQAFDIVCVFKYNVHHAQKEEFIRALSQVVKPDGIVYVTSVEPARFTYDCYRGEAPYLTDTFQKYFGNVSFAIRSSLEGADELMTLYSPKLEPVDELLSGGPSP